MTETNGVEARTKKPANKGRKVRGVFWRDGRWWIRWACTLGHDHLKPSGNEKTAATEEHKAKRAEIREARKAGGECCPRLVPRARPVLFGEILADFLGYSQATKRSYKHDLARAKKLRGLFADRLVTEITCKDVEGMKSALADEHSVATANQYLKLMKAVFNRALRHGHVAHNPVAAVKLYRENNARNRCLSPEEEAALLEALPSRRRPFVIVALHTGMRRGELRARQWEDVDFSTNTLRVRQDKAGEGRWVALNSVARAALLQAKREHKVLSPLCILLGPREVPPQLRAGLAPSVKAGQHPGLPLPRLPPYLRLQAGHGGCRSLHRAAGGWVEDAGDGSALRAPEPRPHAGSGRTLGEAPISGSNWHKNWH
jgi:integrase